MSMNSRILVIDDEENVRDSMRAMLVPRPRDTSEIDALGDQLFGPAAGGQPSVPSPSLPFRFEVDTAATGQEGLRRVQEALAAGKPYAALFVDMRMPGWDGLTTVQRIREIDTEAEVIFVTAYSDYGVQDIIERAGMNVAYHCKPFSSEEIQQVAIKAVFEWNNARLQQEMQKQQKIAALGAAIGMVAHDLRSPIGIIQNAIDLLDGERQRDDTMQKWVDCIRNAATESMSYVQDLLDFVRGDEMDIYIEPVVARDLLCDLAEEARKRFSACDFTVDVDLPGEASLVMDRTKMRRALVNLINNAAEALRDHEKEDAPCVRLRCGVEAGKGWIAVSDNGPGLPEKVKEQLYSLFVTLNKAGGTGLGLAIVKKYCDAQNLTLHQESGSAGTTFTLSGFKVAIP